MDELTNRNFQALAEALKEQRSKNSEQDDKIKNLEGMVAQLQSQLGSIEARVTQAFVKSIGTGSTSRG